MVLSKKFNRNKYELWVSLKLSTVHTENIENQSDLRQIFFYFVLFFFWRQLCTFSISVHSKEVEGTISSCIPHHKKVSFKKMTDFLELACFSYSLFNINFFWLWNIYFYFLYLFLFMTYNIVLEISLLKINKKGNATWNPCRKT